MHIELEKLTAKVKIDKPAEMMQHENNIASKASAA
jgi:hypothetical protein